MSISVVEINIYPIKSCRRIPLTEATLDARGFKYDRRFMITRPDYSFITQRQISKLAVIQPDIDSVAQVMRVTAPEETETLSVPLEIQPELKLKPVDARVWKVMCKAHDMGDEAATWLSRVLDTPVRLVRMADDFVRPVGRDSPLYSREYEGQVGFADCASFLLTNVASLEELNTKLPSAVPMTRFRPNIVIKGARAFEEETWSKIQIGDIVLESAEHCARCKITTINQDTGKSADVEPLNTLRRLRFSSAYEGALFGVTMVHTNKGVLRIGDKLSVKSTIPAPELAQPASSDTSAAPTAAPEPKTPTVAAKHCRKSSFTFCTVLAAGLVLNLVLYAIWRSQHVEPM